jgi:enoyl-CoA hydratase
MSDQTAVNSGSVELSFDDDRRIATVMLDRPAKLNALTPEMLEQIRAAVSNVATSGAELVIIRAQPAKAFCVGADIERFAGLAPTDMWRDWTRRGHEIFEALSRLRQPSIAVLGGHAFGGGLELALACDFRIATDNTRLGLPEVGLGTVPGWGGSGRLTKLIGPARAKDMILTRRQLDASTALDWGLLTRVAPAAELEAELDALITSITSGAPVAVQLAKELIDSAAVDGPTSLLEALTGGLTASTSDVAEGVAAFRDRRDPNFGGH